MATRITLQTEIDIQFSDKEKAEEFFIHSDWSNYFFKYHNLDELCEHLAFMFHREGGSIGGRAIEGFGNFKLESKNLWVSEADEFGKIHIRVESELEETDTDEIADFCLTAS